MSESDWLDKLSVGIVVVAILLLTIGGKSQLMHAGDYRKSANNPSDSEQVIVAACAIYETIEAVSTCERQKADLEAQRDMARAAYSAVWVSVVALIGLALTVHFARKAWLASAASAEADNKALELARTQLKEARESAIEAQRVGEAQVRAYLTFEKPSFKISSDLRLLFDIHNTGQSPARFIRCEKQSATVVALRSKKTFGYARTDGESQYLGALRSGTNFEPELIFNFGDTVISEIKNLWHRDQLFVTMAGRIKWIDVFDHINLARFQCSVVAEKGVIKPFSSFQVDGVTEEYIDTLWRTAKSYQD